MLDTEMSLMAPNMELSTLHDAAALLVEGEVISGSSDIATGEPVGGSGRQLSMSVKSGKSKLPGLRSAVCEVLGHGGLLLQSAI